jgi:hypothetical protein
MQLNNSPSLVQKGIAFCTTLSITSSLPYLTGLLLSQCLFCNYILMSFTLLPRNRDYLRGQVRESGKIPSFLPAELKKNSLVPLSLSFVVCHLYDNPPSPRQADYITY